MAKITTIIAKNPTGIDRFIEDLGVTIVATGQRILTDSFDEAEIISSDDLKNEVTLGNIVINDGTSDLSVADALKHLVHETEYEDVITVLEDSVVISSDVSKFNFTGSANVTDNGSGQVTVEFIDELLNSVKEDGTQVVGNVSSIDFVGNVDLTDNGGGEVEVNVLSSNSSDNISVDTTNFDRNLSVSDNTVQKALETLDELDGEVDVEKDGISVLSDANIIDFRGGVNVTDQGSGRVRVEVLGDDSDEISTDTTNFNNILSSSENTVQKALDVLDDHTHALDDLSDVVITTPADNEVVAYDTTSGDFINQTAGEAGLATSSDLTNHINNNDVHREINDGSTSTTDLWSGSYIYHHRYHQQS